MAEEHWSAAEEALLRTLVEDGLNDAEITERFVKEGIARTYKAIQRKRQKKGWHPRISISPFRSLDNPLVMEGDALLFFDIHAPFHDSRWMNRCIDLALRLGIKQCGIGGDLIDLTAFSKYGRKLGVEGEDEIVATEQIVKTLASVFDRVSYCGGNHEVRLARVMNFGLDLERIMKFWVSAPNVEVTGFHWFRLLSAGREFYIEHPKNASVHATVVPKRLCAKYGCSVIAGHGHLWGMTMDDSNRHFAIDSGICADPARLDYNMVQHNTRPQMMQGAVLVMDGVPLLLGPSNIGVFEQMAKECTA